MRTRKIVIGLLGLAIGMLIVAAVHADAQEDVLTHLNAAINWYKNLTTQVPPGQQPSDSIYLTNAENLGAEVVRLAFQSARAQAATPQSSAPGNTQNNPPNGGGISNFQRYAQMEAEVSQRIADEESQIAALKRKPTKSGKTTAAQQEESLEGKLALDKAALDAVQQLKKFVENSNSGGTGLERSINELARSVPELFEPQLKTTTPAPAQKAAPQASSGLIGQLMSLYGEMQSIRSIEQMLGDNEAVQKAANDLRGPLRKQLADTLQQGKDLGAQSGVSKEQYDGLTQRFKQLSAALVPLSEEIVVLDQSRSNLLQWRKSHTTESQSMLVSILTRVGIILLAIGLILALAEAWRRLTFRYVHDPRRRRQFLILRRFVMGFFICLVVILGFVSEFSSLATFAGFVTAGIAVGLQTVLLSVAAYFFVIGRYGIRVGDRITIAGVTGDVIDLGLVRFYLMEYSSTGGVELYPTGRIVVFSNSVLFQATTPLYKQLPGTNYTWHEAVLPLAPGADHDLLQNELYGAIDSVFKEYSEQSAWKRAFDNQLDIAMKAPMPEQRLIFADAGTELVVRYPVDLHHAPEIDDKITRALMRVILKNDKLAAGVAGAPKIRSAVKS